MQLDAVFEKTELMRKNRVELSYCAGICLMYQCGCRISSILQIEPSNVTLDGRVLLRQGKGSMPMVVYPVYYRDFWVSMGNSGKSPFLYQNYIYYYRLFKKYGLGGEYNFGENKAVTASARKSLARDVFGSSGDIEMTAVALGHRNQNSTTFYVEDKSNHIKQKKGILDNPKGIVNQLVICKNGVIRTKKSTF